MYVHNSLTATKTNFFAPSEKKLWEGLSLKIESDQLRGPIIAHTVYRPPREKSGLRALDYAKENHINFLSEFTPYINQMKSCKENIIVFGDLNYDLLETIIIQWYRTTLIYLHPTNFCPR